jgi:hypothetical protein
MPNPIEEAMAEVAKLPAEEQAVLATLLLDEIRSEPRWAEAFKSSQDALKGLAGAALAKHREGRTRPLDESI